MKISIASGNEDKSCRWSVEDLVVKYHETKTYEKKKNSSVFSVVSDCYSKL